jgi:hypothetical protein
LALLAYKVMSLPGKLGHGQIGLKAMKMTTLNVITKIAVSEANKGSLSHQTLQ